MYLGHTVYPEEDQRFLPQLDKFYFTTGENPMLKIADALFRISSKN
jgi:hypothetical protein